MSIKYDSEFLSMIDNELETDVNATVNSPEVWLREIGSICKLSWPHIDPFRRAANSQLKDVKPWCFLEMDGWVEITRRFVVDGGLTEAELWESLTFVQLSAALGTWRYSQGVYRFDETVYEALLTSTATEKIPCEALFRLPEWCVYVETPGLFEGRCVGFWAFLDWHRETQKSVLCLVLNLRNHLRSINMFLGDWSIEDAFNRTLMVTLKSTEPCSDLVSLGAKILRPCVSLLLYLCQSEPEIDDLRLPGSFPARASERRVKGGYRMFPADRVRVWSVGKETGEMIRKAWQGGEHGKVRPHLRRAHWHGYWTGPLAGERKFSYKWLPPIPVGG